MTDHPTEVARKALLAAAAFETEPHWINLFGRFAKAMPRRASRDGSYDGEDLMTEVFDLMRLRLPELPQDDPHRPVASWFLAELGPRLGRPRSMPAVASLAEWRARS